MERLLDVIPAIIAGYLPPSDALNLGRTCRKLNGQLSLRATGPRKFLTQFFRDDRDDEVHRGFLIPVLTQFPVHTVAVSMDWMDQGWGHRKSWVSIVAEEEGRAYDAPGQGRFGGRRAVFSSGLAEHREEKLGVEFSPRKGESYRLWYAVGGGGGHSLRIRNACVRALLFDDPSLCLGRAHDFLVRCGVCPPWDSDVRQADSEAHATILASASHLLARDIPIPPPMLDFFAGRGVSGADISVKLIRTVQSLWEEWKAESLAYVEGDSSSSGGRRHNHPAGLLFANLRWNGRA